MIRVSRYDAYQYLAWLRLKTGRDDRLPSEAEWEYADRAGTTTQFRWEGHCDGCSSPWDRTGTAPVGSFAPNPFGLHDVSGNVSEWVEDCCHPNYDGAPNDGSAWKTGDEKCAFFGETRGGSWGDRPVLLTLSHHTCMRPSDRISTNGFRVVRTLDR